ncbi:hypothetical protein BATDEDRAFT_27915 [Batrachochytrium dendrobatidis JAM81]|uniref:Uncharacterized protein n=2 Tax=Batrachochytrium dendrobatidis TaxID=109871 RepID=F4PC24_BATDJ|nr:uncharacterized protein BATDEDRAFT_27915 [Batrachochytrium dendrobatidis JAM81]EGF77235.1 hypothetical protein BATDEDRAFT_27915 [Batrachochytrium dendrobatidis JAM81]KAK5665492.1 hypothetical protein QVD99_007839 [Batrachochytrium dendrobatidis]OAJ44708.1 hypothetical protein BDEG_27910 [Batrachochytrium dendrobatidis JEL423]|eukprot:XP_006682192.1 hypothetical protein BATDEDRAFT_27915 [Batrachochytrium dendrobatidis JAM81]
MTLQPPDYFVLMISALLVIFGFVILYRLSKLPSRLYANCLRYSGACLIANVIIISCWEYIYEFRGPIGTSISNFLMSIEALLFIVAQLEFLKIFTTFFKSITHELVLRAQICIVVISQIYVFSAFYPLYPPTMHYLRTVQIIWPAVFGLYDLFQQVFLIYFVLYKLRSTTKIFRLQFVILAFTGLVIMIGGAYIELCIGYQMGPSISLLGGLTMHLYGECSVASMEILRIALQDSIAKRPKNQYLNTVLDPQSSQKSQKSQKLQKPQKAVTS